MDGGGERSAERPRLEPSLSGVLPLRRSALGAYRLLVSRAPIVRRGHAALRRRLHPALRATLRRRLQTSPPAPHVVTVIVPVFDVESYLEECLTSIVGQSYRQLQIIVVDDGSRDGSLAIARSYARWDRRISVVQQENRGLGAARNTGIARASGTYLCFVDSDDVLPVDAIARMVTAIQRSSSDFVVGALTRLSHNGHTVPSWVTRVHARDRWGLRLEDLPEVLTSVFAWNKLFDRSFFDSAITRFPEGVLYEDQEPTARAYAYGTFDVLRACTYHWRERADGTSITQQKDESQNLRDRLLVMSRVLPVVTGAGAAALRAWLIKTLTFDLRPYLAVVYRTDPCFWADLRAAVLELAPLLDEDLLLAVPFTDRYCALALIADQRDAVVSILTTQDEYGSCLPGVVVEGRVIIDADYLTDCGFLPGDQLLALASSEVHVVATLSSWEWCDHRLQLAGSAFVSNLPTEPDSVVLGAVATDGTTIDLSTTAHEDVMIDVESLDAWNSHAHGSFRAALDVRQLSRSKTWRLVATVSAGGLAWSGPLRRDTRGAAAEIPLAPRDAHGRWIIDVTGAGLHLRHRARASIPVDITEITATSVTFGVDDPSVRTIRALGGPGTKPVEATTDATGRPGHLVLRLPDRPPPGPQRTDDYRLAAVTAAGRTAGVCAAAGAQPLREAELSPITESSDGALGLRRSTWSAAVSHVELIGDSLLVHGRLHLRGAERVSAVLAADREEHLAEELQLSRHDGAFTARFAVADLSKRRGFSFRLRLRQRGERHDLWVPVGHHLNQLLPLDLQSGVTAATFTRTLKAGALWVRLRHPYRVDERGPLAQRRRHRRHQRAAGVAQRPAVLFDVFSGSGTSDSPRALFEVLRHHDLGLELFWAVEDASMEVPAGARPLLLHSSEWFDVLTHARFLVNNHHLPFYFRKRPGQTYVQTWHGTPLKRIGNDIASPRHSSRYAALMRREAGYWDLLLAQNDFAAERLPTALGYEGPVLNVGYPRNDALVDDRAVARRAATRSRLGLGGRTAVLYAPTWRDRESSGGHYSFIDHLDHAELRRRCGDDVTVLIRGHPNTRHARPAPSAGGPIDVTDHPDVNELILAADVLITDYSSLMFDFCVTGKPLIFLTPDLELYRDQVRGFYLDFERLAPGPLCRTTAEVVACLKHPAELRAAYAERYRRFRAEFAPRDDGAAGERVVDAIWGSHA